MINLSLNILESDSQISKAIKEALVKKISKAFKRSLSDIEPKIKYAVIEAIKSESEYGSLMGGTLRYDFGIPNTSNVDQVIDAMVNRSFYVSNKPVSAQGSSLSGGFTIQMIKNDDIDALIMTDIASTIDMEGYSLPWLKWLLREGNAPLVKDYKVSYGPNANSRSGNAVMVEEQGSSWSVPGKFSGTITENWITRAVSKLDGVIINIIKSSIEKYI